MQGTQGVNKLNNSSKLNASDVLLVHLPMNGGELYEQLCACHV
jgi:hypothetical protein